LIYLGVFWTAFGAATLLPFYSELLVVPLARRPTTDLLLLWLAATSGNTLGAVVNWYLGRFCLQWQDRKFFPIKPKALQRWQRFFQRYGKWSLLLAWSPIGGDALTLVAGIMRIKIGIFLLLVAFGKGLRYLIVIALALNVAMPTPV